VACFSAQGLWKKRLRESGAKIYSITGEGEPQRFWNPRAWLRLMQACRRFRPDLVTGSMFEGILHAHVVARVFQIPLVVEDQFDPWGKGGRLGRVSYHCAARHSRLAVSVSQRGALYLQRRVGLAPQRVRTIYNPANLLRTSSSKADSLSWAPGYLQKPCIGTLCRLDDRHKKISLMLEAVGRLGTGVRVLIVGDGPDRGRLQRYARLACPDSQILFVGYRSNPSKFLQAMDIFVIPSAHEAMPLSLAEAMMEGRCCVGSRVGGIVEILGPRTDDRLGECGKLFSPGNTVELAEILRNLLALRIVRRNFERKAASRARRLFQPERHARLIEQAYYDAVGLAGSLSREDPCSEIARRRKKK